MGTTHFADERKRKFAGKKKKGSPEKGKPPPPFFLILSFLVLSPCSNPPPLFSVFCLFTLPSLARSQTPFIITHTRIYNPAIYKTQKKKYPYLPTYLPTCLSPCLVTRRDATRTRRTILLSVRVKKNKPKKQTNRQTRCSGRIEWETLFPACERQKSRRRLFHSPFCQFWRRGEIFGRGLLVKW